MLNVFIGLVLVFLLYSLLATAIMELLNSFLSLRGKNLEKALRNMLDSNGDGLFVAFKENPLYQQLGGRFIGKSTPPSYLTSEKFRSILLNILDRNGAQQSSLEDQIQLLPEGSLKEVLLQLLKDAGSEAEAFHEKVELWFNDVMDRAGGWFKRNTQRILIVLGFSIAIVFNVDSLYVYSQLSKDPDTSNRVAMEAAKLVGEQEIPLYDLNLRNDLQSILAQNLEVLKSPLGLGWDEMEFSKLNALDWLAKAFGWVVTAMAISIGAPFWFDLLRKMINIRASGKAVDNKS